MTNPICTTLNFDNVIAVNVSRSIEERNSVLEAASYAWIFDNEEKLEMLQNAKYVIAVAGNYIQGVFENLETSIIADEGNKVEFALAPFAPLAPLIGHPVPESVRWKQGEQRGWKPVASKEVEKSLEHSKAQTQRFGAFNLKLTGEGNLQVIVPAGFNVEILSAANLAPAKHRIEQAVKKLAETKYVCTYGILAQALGINSPRSIGRSIARNKEITKAEGARVFNASYIDDHGAIVPDDGMITQDNDKRTRPELLAAEGVATLENGKAFISKGAIIDDPIVLRIVLNI